MKKNIGKYPAHPAHAIFKPNPLHTLELRVAKHENIISVTTDRRLRGKGVSTAYRAELTAHVLTVEREQAISMAKPKPFRFYTESRGRR